MREYVPGDDLRRIVWRASARTGKVMVREAEQGITDHITLILDTDRARTPGDGEGLSESFEAGIRVAASLGVRHLRDGYELRCETNAGPLVRPLRGGGGGGGGGPAGGGAGSQLMLLDAMARLELDRKPLSDVIMRLVSSPRRDAHNVLITPRLGQLEAAQLKLLAQHRGVDPRRRASVGRQRQRGPWDGRRPRLPGRRGAPRAGSLVRLSRDMGAGSGRR